MVDPEGLKGRPDPEPNGDISGPGVLAGFMGSAYLTIIVLTTYYLLVFQPRRNPYAENCSTRLSTKDGRHLRCYTFHVTTKLNNHVDWP